MQLVDQNNIEKRVLFYLSKMYSQSINKGQNYNEINRCISILFTDFNIKNLKNIHKYITKWNLREEKYMSIILTNSIEIYIIELPKVEMYTENAQLDAWVKFISNSGDIDMSKVEEPIKGAKEVLEQISTDEREKYLAHLRLKYILDQRNVEATGMERKAIEIAKKLLNKNIDISIIVEVTGLTKEEIEKL